MERVMQGSPVGRAARYDPRMGEDRNITVAVGRFDDLIARGLRGLIDDDERLDLIAEDITPAQLPMMLRSRRPDVAILDAGRLRSPAEVRSIAARHPATHVLLLAERPTSVESAQLLAF